MLHQHGDEVEVGEFVGGAECGLVKHLQSFHNSCCHVATNEWHLHFVAPWSMSPEGEPENLCYPSTPVALLDNVSSATFDLCVNDSASELFSVAAHASQVSPLSGSVVALEPLELTIGEPGSFLDVLLQQSPLCAVTGVSRC